MNHAVKFPITEPEDDCDALIALFSAALGGQYNTRLVKGGDEPEYIPENSKKDISYHQIIFTKNYFASALHELAHWCVAGSQRRLLPDYGYWYAPDGRSIEQQAEFEQVEVKPQALEWMFAKACGVKFRVSADNLAAGLGASEAFKAAIVQQAQHNCVHGVNDRARALIDAFASHYGVEGHLDPAAYCLDDL